MAKWFPDPVMHLGMDEVNAMCWDQPENNLNLVTAPMAKFARRVIDIVQRNGKQLMAWDEVVASYNLSNSPLLHGQNILPTNAIVQVWEDPSGGNINPSDAGVPLGSDPIQNMVQIVSSLGYSVVASPSNAWYLDCSPQAPWCADKDSNGNPTWHRWEKVYDYDPTSGISKFEHVIGGEVAMWSETLKGKKKIKSKELTRSLGWLFLTLFLSIYHRLTLADNIDYMIWPRAAAAAERLWSPASAAVRNPHTQLRLDRFRASLINELGIGAAPTTDTVGFPSSTKLFYRVEWCDFNLDTPAQKSSDVYAGMKPDSLPLSDYCGIASLYDTDTIIRSPPSRISYPF